MSMPIPTPHKIAVQVARTDDGWYVVVAGAKGLAISPTSSLYYGAVERYTGVRIEGELESQTSITEVYDPNDVSVFHLFVDLTWTVVHAKPGPGLLAEAFEIYRLALERKQEQRARARYEKSVNRLLPLANS